MIEYIKGVLIEASPLRAIVETNGLGYCIYIPLSNYTKLPKTGTLICLFLSAVIREDSHKYFGFLTCQERDLFEDLIATSGIGPKTALSLLGHIEPADLQLAISQSDITRICKVPGIGKKTAERLIVEMKDKIKKMPALPPSLSLASLEKGVARDALSALINLGYQPLQVQKTLQAILERQENIELSELISCALKKL